MQIIERKGVETLGKTEEIKETPVRTFKEEVRVEEKPIIKETKRKLNKDIKTYEGGK